MTTSELAHGEDWAGEDLTGWYLSEKFDGCRAFWDGSKMWTRQGHEIAMPDWFRAQLPAVALDGELWCGYGTLARASVAVRLGRIGRSCRLLVFDAPTAPGDWLDRMAVAKRALAGCSVASAVSVTLAKSSEHAVKLMRSAQMWGGEGLVARRPGVAHKPGRSRDILKVKSETPPALSGATEADDCLTGLMSLVMR